MRSILCKRSEENHVFSRFCITFLNEVQLHANYRANNNIQYSMAKLYIFSSIFNLYTIMKNISKKVFGHFDLLH